jgi:hypothetical protein
MSFLGPFPVEDAIARLKAYAPILKIVGGAAGLSAALGSKPNNAPAAYVLTSERGGQVKYMGPLAQQNVGVSIQVVLFVRSAAGENTGTGAEAQMTQVETAVKAAMFGWSPGDAFGQLAFQAQRPEPYESGWLVRQLIFNSDYRMSQQVP